MPVPRDRVPISMVIGIGIAIITAVIEDALIGDARWGNLVMAGLLMAVLVVYLIKHRYCPHSAAQWAPQP